MENKRKKIKNNMVYLCRVILLMGIATLIGKGFRYYDFSDTNTVIVFLLAVLLTAKFTNGYLYGIIASVASIFLYNYFFTKPIYTLAVDDPDYIITFGVIMVTAIITSTMTTKIQQNVKDAKESESQAKALYQLTNQLTDAKNLREIVSISVSVFSQIMRCNVGCLCFGEDGAPEEEYIQYEASGKFVTRKVIEQKQLQYRIDTLREAYDDSGDFADWPIYGQEAILGVVRIPKEINENLSEAQFKLIRTMVESIAMAMDRFRQRQQAEKTKEQVQQERYRGNILRSISHDLRTPLSGIIGSSEMLMDQMEEESDQYMLAQAIHKDADWLRALVENILNLTKLHEGKLLLKKEFEAVEEIIESTLNLFSRRHPEYEVEVDIPEKFILILVDGKLIMQVLFNLLDNARKHSNPEDGVCIKVKESEDGRNVIFSVIDGGEGIAEQDLPHLFQMFYTSECRQVDVKRGIGLGLAICEAIVKAHGGSICAANRTDSRGAEFTFVLPKEEKKKDE